MDVVNSESDEEMTESTDDEEDELLDDEEEEEDDDNLNEFDNREAVATGLGRLGLTLRSGSSSESDSEESSEALIFLPSFLPGVPPAAARRA